MVAQRGINDDVISGTPNFSDRRFKGAAPEIDLANPRHLKYKSAFNSELERLQFRP
jgi:hypothetical protein